MRTRKSCLRYQENIALIPMVKCRFNQTTVSYDATKEEKVEVLKRRQAEVEERLREKKGLGSP
jgi:hypothetical protein